MHFEIISDIDDIQIIAKGSGVRRRATLNARYGKGNWRKLKGNALVRLADGEICSVELHWYEAHGIGKKLFKIKNYWE